jgi:hypothetical protein
MYILYLNRGNKQVKTRKSPCQVAGACVLLRQLVVEDILQSLLVYIAVELGEIRRQLDVLRAGLYAVLAVATAGDTAFFHQGIQTLRSVEFSQRMQVE